MLLGGGTGQIKLNLLAEADTATRRLLATKKGDMEYPDIDRFTTGGEAGSPSETVRIGISHTGLNWFGLVHYAHAYPVGCMWVESTGHTLRLVDRTRGWICIHS